MALINCPECKKEVSDQALICPHCGYVLKSKNKMLTLAIACFTVLVLFVAAGFLIYRQISPRLSEKESAIYEMMCEICRQTDEDLETIQILDSSTYYSNDLGGYQGYLKVKAGGNDYYIKVDFKDGRYEFDDLDRDLQSMAEDEMKEDDKVNYKKIQKALEKSIISK